MRNEETGFKRLELNVETLRELTDGQLGLVVGGAASGVLCNATDYVPSGSAWTPNCNTTTVNTGSP